MPSKTINPQSADIAFIEDLDRKIKQAANEAEDAKRQADEATREANEAKVRYHTSRSQ